MGMLYNKFDALPYIPYKIVEKLATSNNENLWKALYYDDYKCLSNKDLTFDEKINLIWKNQSDEENYRVFLKPLVSNAITSKTTQIRIYNIATKPISRYKAVSLYAFAIITNDKIALIEEGGVPIPRIDYIKQQIIKELNGKFLGLDGTTNFEYNKEIDREMQDRLSISNSQSFYGDLLIMGTTISNLGTDGCGN